MTINGSPATPRVVLGVTACIGAYKAAEIVRRLRDRGVDVVVVPTENSLNFVGAATWEALSGHPARWDTFRDVDQVAHIRLAEEADAIVVAPATADFLARYATGRADDLLTNVLLAARCPVLVSPAMHTQMWQHPATQANVDTLRERGVMVKNPDSGRLTGPDSGAGRFPNPHELVDHVMAMLAQPRVVERAAAQDLAGLKVTISAGGTREYLDPVRYLGNESSGRMGVALAQAAAARGADVTLVAAHIEVELPGDVTVRRVTSTADLAQAMAELGPMSDVVIMAAAVADFTSDQAAGKIKKSADRGLELSLKQTTDVLAELGRQKSAGQSVEGQIIVGFAAETASDRDELVQIASAKRLRKGADLLVANDVSGGAVFGQSGNDVVVIGPSGIVAQSAGEKLSVAHDILNSVLEARRN